MATNRRDVNLIIRAKDEGSKAFEAAASALESLLNVNTRLASSADGTASRLDELAAAAVGMDKAYSQIHGSADRASAAFDRQKASIAAQKQELAALQAQAKSAADVMARLQSPQAVVDAGKNQAPRLAQLKLVETEFNRLTAASGRLNASISTQEAELNGQVSSLQRLGSTAIAAESAHEQLAAAIELENIALRENAALSAKAATAQSAFNSKFAPGLGRAAPSAQASAAVFQDADRQGLFGYDGTIRANAAAMKEMESAAARLRGQLNPLLQIEEQLAYKQAELIRLRKAGKISADELTAGLKLLKAEAKASSTALNAGQGIDSRGRPALFGLKPYQLQNLSYQVNDVFTQLASGTSITQTLAQQMGQIIQLFPKVGSGIVAAFRSPPILATAVAIGAVAIAIAKAQDQAQTLRTFEGLLAATAGGATAQASAVAAASRELDRYGLSASEAVAVVRVLLKEGVRTDQIVAFGEAARDLSVVLGIDVKDAAKQVADAFTGGAASVEKFDDSLNFLTATQRAHIRQLFEEGRAQEARNEALRIFSDRQDDAADKMRGPWAQAVESLKNAWESFITFLAGNSVIQTLAGGINLLAQSVDALFTALGGAQGSGGGSAGIPSALPETASLDAQIKEAKDNLAAIENVKARIANPEFDKEFDERLKIQRALIAGLEEEQKKRASLTAKADAALKREVDALKQQNGLLSEKARLGKAYTDALLDAQERFPNASSAAHAAFAEQARLRVEKQITEERKRQADELARQARDPLLQTMNLLKGFEGFQKNAKWDVNAFRLGFGSDTMTGVDGSVSRVTAKSTTDLTGAMRDLERRAREFLEAAKTQVGSDRFNSFSPQQQAALASIAYNYGELPKRIIEAVRTGSAEEIATAVRGLGGDNGGINRNRRNREAEILGAPNVTLEANTQKQVEDLAKKQDDYLEKVELSVKEREAEIKFLELLVGKTGAALIAEEKKLFIHKEVAKAKADAAKVELSEDDPRFVALIQRVQQAAAAYYDLQHAKESADAARSLVDQPVEQLTAVRDALQQQIDFMREGGNFAEADSLLPRLDEVNAKLQEAIDKAIAFYQALNPADNPLGLTAEQIERIILGLNMAKLAGQQWGTVLGISAKQIAQAFASQATAAVDKFLQAVAEGKNVFAAAKNAFLEFASSFLRMIAQMIIQTYALIAAKAILKAFGVTVPTNHSGGVVGRDSSGSRKVSPLWFAGAMRYHGGGIAGLKPNEVPTILERGEEVLTQEDPRHRANGGLNPQQGGGPVNLKVINALDAGDMVEQGLNSKAGERAILNFMRNNPGAMRQALGVTG